MAQRQDEPADLLRDGLDTVGDVARFLKVSLSTVNNWISRGILPSVKLGKARRIPHAAVLALAARGLESSPRS